MSNIGRKRKEKAAGIVKKKYPAPPPSKQQIDGRLYNWHRIYGLSEMLDWLGGRVKVAEVEVVHVEKATREDSLPVWSRYSTNLQYINDAFVFDDDSAMVCATISSWGGTFASHDDISVTYYALTPK